MIYSITGTVLKKEKSFAVFDCSGVGLKVFMPANNLRRLPPCGSPATCFCSLRIKDEIMDLYGFLEEAALNFFELVTTVNGVGPRTALAILDIDSLERIIAAILEKRADLLLRASGIGKKTAERIILELQNKLELKHSSAVAEHMSIEIEVEEALVGLGYPRYEAHEAAANVGKAGNSFDEQLRAALKHIGSKNKK